MPKKDLTEIIAVLDRSGSMVTIRADMEGGFDSFIDEQRKLSGECTVTLVQFDHLYESVYAGKALADVPPLRLEPRGMTALLDAIGRTIQVTGSRLSGTPETERPERVLFVIISDGQENASHEFSAERIVAMVRHQTDRYSWQFVYLGANQDAIAEAAKMGISVAANFQANAAGTAQVLRGLNVGTSNYRSGQGYTGGLGNGGGLDNGNGGN